MPKYTLPNPNVGRTRQKQQGAPQAPGRQGTAAPALPESSLWHQGGKHQLQVRQEMCAGRAEGGVILPGEGMGGAGQATRAPRDEASAPVWAPHSTQPGGQAQRGTAGEHPPCANLLEGWERLDRPPNPQKEEANSSFQLRPFDPHLGELSLPLPTLNLQAGCAEDKPSPAQRG